MTATMLHRSEMGTLELSQGALNIDYPNRFPGNFPKSVESRIVITNSSGQVLDTFEGQIKGNLINFTVETDRTQAIPAGAQYSWFVTWSDGLEYQWEHGYVIRTEVHWPAAPAQQIENQPLAFVYQPGSAVGNQWVKKGGNSSLKIWTADDLPNALGIKSPGRKLAASWGVPFATDSVKVVVNTITGGAGKSSVVVCSDSSMTTYLAVQFETGSGSANKLHIMRGTGPLTMTDLITPKANTVANGETYTIVYDNASKIIAVYKGSDLTPTLSWTDETNLIPHGLGYTYGALNYLPGASTPGVKFSYWAMKDN